MSVSDLVYSSQKFTVTASPLDVIMTLGEFNTLFQMVLLASLGSHRKVLKHLCTHHREVHQILVCPKERLKGMSAQRTRTHAFWYHRFRPSGKHIILHQRVDVSGAWDPTSRDPEVMEGGRSEQG